MRDRIVHAEDEYGIEIVRYDRAGKWLVEHASGSMIPCQHVSVREAARRAVEIEADGGIIYAGLPGGSFFDRHVAVSRAAQADPKETHAD